MVGHRRLDPPDLSSDLHCIWLNGYQLRDAGRREDAAERPATELFPEPHTRVLSAWRFGSARGLTLAEFILALGRLGGHQNRRRDPPPGFLVLWRGWTQLQAMVQGAAALSLVNCGET
jgi:hypothetical protein